LTGLPALTSARTLERKASLLVDFLSGILTFRMNNNVI
jgi:hypothetical protein